MSNETQFGRMIVSVIVVIGFVAIVGLLIVRPIDLDPEVLTILNILVGTLAAMFSVVVQYYMGSSSGSKDKDAIIRSAVGGPPPSP
jgi:hypothetical protein